MTRVIRVQADTWKKREHRGGRFNIQVFGRNGLVKIKWSIQDGTGT
jgi:hypothetical protein